MSNSFLYNYARSYYGPSLSDPTQQPEYWSDQPQKLSRPISQQLSGVAGFAATLGGIAALGYAPVGKEKHVWDYYATAFRGFEEYSPAKIFRTFQLSHLISPFETVSRTGAPFVTSELLSKNRRYASYLARVIGEKGTEQTYQKLITEGVVLKEGALHWGKGGIALKHAAVIRGSEFGGVSNIGAAYARRLGLSGSWSQFFKTSELSSGVFNPQLGEEYVAQIIGGKTRAQHLGRMFGTLGTEQVQRFNRLVGMFPLIGKHLSVKSAGGLEMLGRLSMKYGVGLGALALGYETLDWAARKSEVMEGTLFEHGLTYGLASIPVAAHVRAAELAESSGLQDLAREQERIAPGSTDLLKLAAFPFMGVAGMATGVYGYKAWKMATSQISEGISSSVARTRMDQMFRSWENMGGFLKDLGENKLFSKMTPYKALLGVGAIAGLALIAPFIPGALIPQQSPEELRGIYSGEQEVPIRKSRFWELGRSSWEGTNVQYYRPHSYALLRLRGREKSIWGEDEAEISPIEKWWKSQFTYDVEQRLSEERPYPQTASPFQDFPFIGPLLASTLGQWIKPKLYMHTEEFLSDKGVKLPAPGFGARVATEIGQQSGGVPVDQYTIADVLGKEMYRLGTEMPGLTGFISSAIKEKLTGSQDWFDQLSQYEDAGRITSYEREYWERDLGGLAGLSEIWRRLYPHRRRQIERINPIRNLMPEEWIPGPGERGPNLQFGDPFSQIPMGEIRLPGRGYAARFPELEGVEPADYPFIHQLKILGDVAPYSKKYKRTLGKMRAMRARGELSEDEEKMYQETLRQVKSKKQKIEFQEYKHLSDMGELFPAARQESTELLTTINEWKASQEEKPSISQRLFGGYWELLAHNAETAADQLTPISPGGKLVHIRSPIEAYERDVLYGTPNAFWSHPLEHFIKPFGRLTARAFGQKDVPEHAEHIRGIEEYFDILKYVKYSRLSNLARMAKDTTALKEFESKKDETLFGVNPYTRNYTSLYRALPRRERDYFQAFEGADTYEERARILEMVPENEKELYTARWKLTHAQDLKKAIKAGILTEDQEGEAQVELDEIYTDAKNEGMPTSKELFQEYLATKYRGENYADWYRRTKLLPNVESIPGADWVAFHPSVDLEDVKMKLVQEIGGDPIELNLWPSRGRELSYKPFIDEESIQPLLEPEELSREDLQGRIADLLFVDKMDNSGSFATSRFDQKRETEINIEVEEDRSEEIEEEMKKVLSA